MRIAILADPIDNQYAGIHIYTKEFVKALANYPTEHEYILIRANASDEFQPLKNVVVKHLAWLPGYKALRMFVLIPLALRRLKVDAVLEPAHFGPFNLPKRMKRITVIHDLTPILFPQWHPFHSQLLQNTMLRSILKRARLIITNSDNTTSDLLKCYPENQNKVKRIFLGRDESFVATNNKAIIHKYGLSESFFLFTGTIEPRKNLIFLLNAYTMYRNTTDNKHQLVIVGKKGWKCDDFFVALDQHPYRDDIKLLGYVERTELSALYSNCRAFIYPSLYEGFGLPVLEAMSCGAVCIISYISSLPEVGGNAALRFTLGNTAELVELMKLVASDEKKCSALSEQSLIQAKKFSWKQYVEEFEEVVNEKFKDQ